MLGVLLLLLIVLWFFGYVRLDAVAVPDAVLFTLNGQPITLWNILILLVVGWVIGLLPRPFREIASVLAILWILSVLGILAFSGLSSLLVLSMILGLALYLMRGGATDV